MRSPDGPIKRIQQF